MPERPLTDEEIAEKFEIPIGHPNFAAAKLISHNRPDRCISEWPVIDCPHCGKEFTYELGGDEVDFAIGDIIICVHCERRIYIEEFELADDYFDRDDDGGICITLNTHPENER